MGKNKVNYIICLIIIIVCVSITVFLLHATTASLRTSAFSTAQVVDAVKIQITYKKTTAVYVQKNQAVTHFDIIEINKRGYFLPHSKRVELLKDIVNTGHSYRNALEYVFDGLDKTVAALETKINKQPVDSKVNFYPNRKVMFTFSQEKNGYLLETEKLYKDIFFAVLKNNNVAVAAQAQTLVPEYSANFWKASIKLRAEFSTSYKDSTPERKHNVKKALDTFNGMVVGANKQVSFNKTTGSRTEARGYKSAKIILNGRYEDGIGGGVCQSSTTLYNALLLAGIKVTKHSRHTLTSSYVPPSFDAMVNSGGADLVFENDTPLPIFIKVVCDDENVKVIIYGQEMDCTIKRRSVVLKTTPPPPDEVFSDTEGKYADKVLYTNQRHFLNYAKEGVSSEGYLDYYKNGKLIKTVKLRSDVYQPQAARIVVGTKKPPPPPQPSPLPFPSPQPTPSPQLPQSTPQSPFPTT